MRWLNLHLLWVYMVIRLFSAQSGLQSNLNTLIRSVNDLFNKQVYTQALINQQK